jgi:hypothetical protein
MTESIETNANSEAINRMELEFLEMGRENRLTAEEVLEACVGIAGFLLGVTSCGACRASMYGNFVSKVAREMTIVAEGGEGDDAEDDAEQPQHHH